MFKLTRYLVAFLATVVSISCLNAQEIVKQSAVKDDACCPCAIYHAIAFSDASDRLSLLDGKTPAEKVLTMIKLFEDKPSLTYENRSRYSDEHWGMEHQDAAASLNDVMRELKIKRKMKGIYLDRREDESLIGHLHRIHGKKKRLNQKIARYHITAVCRRHL